MRAQPERVSRGFATGLKNTIQKLDEVLDELKHLSTEDVRNAWAAKFGTEWVAENKVFDACTYDGFIQALYWRLIRERQFNFSQSTQTFRLKPEKDNGDR
jgi:hypothetical protein